MNSFNRQCFVIIPFASEFRYVYLFIKRHIEEKYRVRCYRANTEQYAGESIIEQINDYIRSSDFVIADCSNNNPNVLYELGIADALNKDVILIRNDIQSPPLPFDIRHRSVITYTADEDAFLRQLDIALEFVLYRQYDILYRQAQEIFIQFRRSTETDVPIKSLEAFRTAMQTLDRTRDLPDVQQLPVVEIADFLLFQLIVNSEDTQIATMINHWLSQRHT